MSKSIATTMGIDLGDRWSHVHVIDAGTGEIVEERRVRTRRADFEALLGGRQRMRVVIETGQQSNWVARLIERLGHEALVAQARRLRMIYQNPRKSDAVDAQMLAQLGSTHPELLHPVKVRSASVQAHLATLRSREVLVRSRTRLICSVRGQVKSFGGRIELHSSSAFPRKARAACPRELLPAIRPLLTAIAQLTRSIRTLDREIQRLCCEVYAKETRHLLEVPGVGSLTALTLVLIVGDPGRFGRVRDVGAYLGLVPRRDQSGECDRQLRISKCGDPMARRILVQAAHRILGPRGGDSDLRRWGLERASQGGKKGKRRIVVAVARRLAVTLVAIWKNDRVFQPFRTPVASTVA